MSLTQRILFLAPASAVTRVFPELRDKGYEVGLAENIKGAAAFIRKASTSIIFSRPNLPGYKVEDLLEVSENDPNFPQIIIITEKGNATEAEHYMSLGAKDYWLEPISAEKIFALLNAPKPRAVSPQLSSLGVGKNAFAKKDNLPLIVGSDPTMKRVLALAKQVAPSKATVLISGESGTGKEMFSKYLHAASDRANGPFIAVNCAALPEHLLESELFGHEKGAFTGAIVRKLGKFEMADKGTILLDEISEMDLSLQAKLLRVLQESEIDRVGGTETVKVDVRVLATTNRDLNEWVSQGKFRQDLYFRLNVIPLRLPSLRERGEDIFELARFFINLYVKEYKLPNMDLSQEALDFLAKHDFEGNVRELQNLMERAVLLANGKEISPKHFLLEQDSWPLFTDDNELDFEDNSDSACQKETTNEPLTGADPNEPYSGALIPLAEMERIMIIKGLEVTSGNRTQAAELLGISVRTLRNKLNEYREMGIQID